MEVLKLVLFFLWGRRKQGDASPSWKARERYRIQRKDVIEFAWYTNHSGCYIARPEAIADR